MSAFNLKPGEDFAAFRTAYAAFIADIRKAGIIEDAAYAHIERMTRPATGTHLAMFRRIADAVFLCWEDCT